MHRTPTAAAARTTTTPGSNPIPTTPSIRAERATEETDDAGQPPMRIHWTWLGMWALLTTFAMFEVVEHGYLHGTATEAALLTATAIGFFVAPDLTFLVGAGQPAAKGHLPPRAVPWYNTMHRIWLPLTLTSIIGIALAPLAFFPLVAFVGGLSWMAHIALDRAAGYGLRNPDGSRSHA